MAVDDKIRKSAVAGRFYPASPKELRDDVDKYLAAAAPTDKSTPASVNVLVAPHAGYIFSASVAAGAYVRASRAAKTVILIGPSHHKRFDGVHVTDARYYETPLGKVEVNQEINAKLSGHPLCLRAPGAEENEHCLEVQLPFLQVLLGAGKFTIVPLITGNVGAKAVAEMLLPFVDDTTMVVASSDLSHYQPQREARDIDDATISTVLSGNAEGFMEACGETAIRVAMEIAAKKGLSAELIDARTSYETAPEYGDPHRVVGYAAIAFVKNGAEGGGAEDFSQQEREYMLKLARETLKSAVRGGDTRQSQPKPKPELSRLARNYGCFVTLNSHGQLRGCIGNIEPIKPLYKGIADNAANAAFHDPRFPKIKATELEDIKIEVSVLTRPAPLGAKSPDDILKKLVPFEHGVILKLGPRQSTFLPQVWEQLPDKVMFLEHLAMKAGAGRDDWKRADVWVYRAVHFAEGGE
ncbi:MAG: AmmeMemoRadiSam system protein B [Chitinispirillales bacterium]|jgi:AmmeMemoRadiSam system protein B/AmmeMemoRadiSam system protein A|nr:AmmeMemoRadiSam system protein B [Chitinispirillales bacterium]